MNITQKKKIVAALGGVMQYLDEESRLMTQTQVPRAPHIVSPVWTSYGRQTTMMNAQMMQRRVIRR